jgi:hypothetical protein
MIIRELLKPAKKNLVLVLVFAASLGVVQMQAVWLFQKFETTSGRITHIIQSLSLPAAKTANLLTTLFVIILCSVVYGFERNPPRWRPISDRPGAMETFRSYAVTTCWVLFFGAALIAILGGIQKAIEDPGQFVPGQAFLLILVSIGKVPLVRKIGLRRAVQPIDIVLYTIMFVVTLFNSRFLGAFALLQLAVIYHYRRKEASLGVIVGIGAALVGIFVFFGLYRDYAVVKYTTGGATSLEYVERSVTNGDALDWLYSKDVEGFVGLVGILTYESDQGKLDHDYGMSNLQLFTQLVPANLRTDANLPFKSLSDTFEKSYPYRGTIVPSGLEASYAHFGIFGPLLLAVGLGYLIMLMHRLLLETQEASVPASLVSVHLMSLVREMLWTTSFFILGDLFAVFCYHKIVAFAASQVPTPLEHVEA